jgi:mono/diheme cytochrome c family protein
MNARTKSTAAACGFAVSTACGLAAKTVKHRAKPQAAGGRMEVAPFLRRAIVALCLLAVVGCAQDMARQPQYRPLAPSDFFADGRSARPVVPGTVARGQLRIDSALYTGRDEKGELVTEFPFAMTTEVLQRGKERFTIFCSVCHGLTGQGDGRIVQRGFTKPPSYTKDKSRYYSLRDGPEKAPMLIDVPVGHFFDVISNGFGAMPDYATQVPVKDRWAIAGYVRTLQYSQSPQLREKMDAAGKKGGKK